MNILFVWTGVTSYMADCWRELAAQPDAELKIIIEPAVSGKEFNADRVLAGLDYSIVTDEPSTSYHKHSAFSLPPTNFVPDVIFAGGWRSKTTRYVLSQYPTVPKLFCLDMPWRWKPRCIVARWALHSFLKQFDGCWVPGTLAYRYARWLGFPKDQVWTKLYAVKQDESVSLVDSDANKHRAGFYYAGRFSQEKRIDLLLKSYARYRELGGTWSLDMYGGNASGIQIPSHLPNDVMLNGFLQPEEMSTVIHGKACLLMASSFDPWPLAILEAKSSGCEVIASDRCGNADELGAIKVPYGNVEAMARAMIKVEGRHSNGSGFRIQDSGDRLEGKAQKAKDSGSDAQALKCSDAHLTICSIAKQYNCEAWAKNSMSISQDIIARNRFFCPGMKDIANGMAVVAKLLAKDASRPPNEFIVHSAWLPIVWWQCLKTILSKQHSLSRFPSGSFSPIYLELQSPLKKRLVKPIERWLLRKSYRVIATCESEKRWILDYEPKANVEVIDLKKYFKIQESGIRVQESGLRNHGNAERQTSNVELNATPMHVLYLGRRHPLKGVEYLEKAVDVVNRQKAESGSVELRIVSNASGNEKEKVWEWCDVLCLPTLSENFGLVVAEALERGKRIIVTDGAPAWEDLPDSQGIYIRGYLAATPDERVKLLVEALNALQ